MVREPEARAAAVERVLAAARELGFEAVDLCDSQIAGQDGNLELLTWLRWDRR